MAWPGAEVDKLIASCDAGTPAGQRDRAILLFLARLGLRAGDVMSLRLPEIDWADATFKVSGKGRRELRLPLPQDVGD
ncbi:MAG: integrase, partial [Deltaproteobacteria bacterium]|nr:integrase [Deltaproteobacteria bacterium]